MKLSIVIVNYNTSCLLQKCLMSLQQAEGWRDWEIIIVDNGSTEEPREQLKARLTNFKIKIKFIQNRENLGFAKAVNQAIRQSQGQSLLLLNSDTQVKKEAVRELLSLEEKIGPAIIGAKLINPGDIIQPSVFHLPSLRGAVKEFIFGQKNSFSGYAPDSKEPVEVDAVVGGAMVISRPVIEKIGLFDERYFMYFEDLDYCRCARKAGFKIYYLPQAEIFHEHGASGKKVAGGQDHWRRLIPSSKIYHGLLKHWLISQIIRLGNLLNRNEKK